MGSCIFVAGDKVIADFQQPARDTNGHSIACQRLNLARFAFDAWMRFIATPMETPATAGFDS